MSSKSARYRQNLKLNHPEQYQQYLDKQKLRNSNRRTKIREDQNKACPSKSTKIKLQRYRETSRARQKRYREKKKRESECNNQAEYSQHLESCPCCGRSFASETLVKHVKICEKSTNKQRKVFDASKQRLQDLPLDKVQKSSKVPPAKKNNWRRKHEDFIDSMQSAREVSHALKTGAPLPTPVSQKPKVNPDYVQCPSCSRHFSENAAERHIPWCKEQSKKIENKASPTKKKEFNTRTKYKPPLPGARKIQSPKPRTNLSRITGRTGPESSPSINDLEERFIDSAKIGRRRSGPPRQARALIGTRARSMERPRNNSGDSLRRRNYSEDDYDDSAGDENGQDSNLSNGYYSKNSHLLPHHRLRAVNTERGSPLAHRTPTPPSSRKNSLESNVRRPSKFCYECGTKYPVLHAKYCCECGTKRPFID